MTTEANQMPVAEQRQPIDVRMNEFVAMAQYQADTVLPQNGDVYTKAFETTFVDYLQHNPAFYDIYQELFDVNAAVGSDDLLRQNIKTFQFIERRRNPAIFPLNRARPEDWREPMEALIHDVDYQDLFYGNIYLPLASNISERGSPIKASMMLHGIETPKIFDGGCSLNNLLKRMAMEDDPDLHYNKIDIMRRVPGQRLTTPVLDAETTERFNKWLGPARFTPGESIGSDVRDYVRDTIARDRAYSDSHYMGEFTMKKLSVQSEILHRVEPKNIGFMCLDVARFDPSELSNKFDVTILATMLYESKENPVQVQKILQNAREITKDDGIIIVQDFVRRVLKSGTIQFYSKGWPAYSYGLWVEDMQRPELGLRKEFSIYGGRVERMIPEPALADLPLARKLGLVATNASAAT